MLDIEDIVKEVHMSYKDENTLLGVSWIGHMTSKRLGSSPSVPWCNALACIALGTPAFN